MIQTISSLPLLFIKMTRDNPSFTVIGKSCHLSELD